MRAIENLKEALRSLSSEEDYINRFRAISRVEIASLVGILNSSCFPAYRLREWLEIMPAESIVVDINVNLSYTARIRLYGRNESIDITADANGDTSSTPAEWRYWAIGEEVDSGKQLCLRINCHQPTSEHLDRLVWKESHIDTDLSDIYLTASDMMNGVSMEKMVGSTNERTIRGVFNQYTEKCKFDKQWLRSIMQFIISYRMRSEEHINFLGGHSIGIHKLLWTGMDEARWWDLLEVDNLKEVRNAFLDLPTTNKEFKVAGNVTNASFPYVCHRIINGEFSDAEKEKGVMAVMSLMHYQFLSSLFRSPRFKFGASEEISNAAYDALNRKSLLKQHSNWESLIQARSYQLVNGDSKHARAFKEFTKDEDVIYIVIDTQNAIRKIVNRLTEAYYAAHAADQRVVVAASTFIDAEGESVIKDVVNRTNVIINQGLAFTLDAHDLIHSDTLAVTMRLVPSADVRYLKEVLLELVRQRRKQNADAEALVRELVMYMEDYLRSAPPEEKKFVYAIQKVVNMMRSSQATDEKALNLKEYASDLVAEAIGRRPVSVQAATRIALVTYLAVRLMTYQR